MLAHPSIEQGAKKIKRASGTISSSGANTIIAADTTKALLIYAWAIQNVGPTESAVSVTVGGEEIADFNLDSKLSLSEFIGFPVYYPANSSFVFTPTVAQDYKYLVIYDHI